MAKLSKGFFWVQDKQCNQCLFSKNKIVTDSRKKSILKDCENREVHFICHKATLQERGSNVCCYGFFKRNPNATPLMQVAQRLGVVKFIKIE